MIGEGLLEKEFDLKEDDHITKKDVIEKIERGELNSVDDFYLKHSKLCKKYREDKDMQKFMLRSTGKEFLSPAELMTLNAGISKNSKVADFRKLGDAGDLLLVDRVEKEVTAGLNAVTEYASLDDIIAETIPQDDDTVKSWKVLWESGKEPEASKTADLGLTSRTIIYRDSEDKKINKYSHIIQASQSEIERMPIKLLNIKLRKAGRQWGHFYTKQGVETLVSDGNASLGKITGTDLAIEDLNKIRSELGEFDSGSIWLATKSAWLEYMDLPQINQYLFFKENLKSMSTPVLYGAVPKMVTGFGATETKDAIGLLSKATGLILYTEKRNNIVAGAIDIDTDRKIKVLVNMTVAFDKIEEDSFKYLTLT